MIAPKDMIGNPLTEGDLVRVNPAGKDFFGEVMEVRSGGITTGAGESPASVTVKLILKIPTRPGATILDLLVVKRPEEKKGPSLL